MIQPTVAVAGRGGTAGVIEATFSIADSARGKGDLVEGLRRIRAAGFTHLHFLEHWRSPEPMGDAVIEMWLSALEETGLAVLDVHGCHPPGISLWEEDPAVREHALRLCRHRLWLTKELGGDAMVYHVPCHCEPTPEVMARFIDSLKRLEEFTRELGVAIALENHYEVENDRIAFTECFECFAPDYIGFTFDSGHAVRSGNFDWLADHCFERLVVLHLHDNEPGQDRHWLPWHPEGHVDWERVAQAIARSSYNKPLQFELAWKEETGPEHEQFLRSTFEAGERLGNMVDRERQRLAEGSAS